MHEKPFYFHQRDSQGLGESQFLGQFAWKQGKQQYMIHIEELRRQLTPILDMGHFKTSMSDHTFIRVNHLIDRIINFHEVAINLVTGEILTDY